MCQVGAVWASWMERKPQVIGSTLDDALLAKDFVKSQLSQIDGLVVYGIGVTLINGEYVVKVNVEKSLSPYHLPNKGRVLNVPVIIEVVGTIKAIGDNV